MKVCGLRRREDVEAARDADLVGFVVLSPRSPRDLSPERGAALARACRSGQTPVFVTAEARGAELAGLVAEFEPPALQLPAAAGPVVFAALKGRFPATRLFAALSPREWAARPAHADGFVLDAHEDGYGGTGRRVDVDAARRFVVASRRPVLLAGGLDPSNVAEAVRRVRPWGVDASSGLETGGVKDPERIRAFVRAAREAAEGSTTA